MNTVYSIMPHLTRLRSVGLFLTSSRHEATRLARGILERLPNLRRLSLRNGSDLPHSNPLNEFFTIPEPLRVSFTLNLSALVLARFKFNSRNIPPLLSSVNLFALKSLHLLDCKGDDTLLNAMAQHISSGDGVDLPSLAELKLVWFYRSLWLKTSHHRGPVGLINLLRAFSGLQYLFLDLDKAKAPPVDCIVKHSGTLRSLLVNSHPFPDQELIQLCTACTRLSQIAINLPSILYMSDPERCGDWEMLYGSSIVSL